MCPSQDQLSISGVGFYSHLRKKLLHRYDDSEFSEYFPLHTSARRSLKLFGDLLGMKFHEIPVQDENYEKFMEAFRDSSPPGTL
jgi:hypothetical protein